MNSHGDMGGMMLEAILLLFFGPLAAILGVAVGCWLIGLAVRVIDKKP